MDKTTTLLAKDEELKLANAKKMLKHIEAQLKTTIAFPLNHYLRQGQKRSAKAIPALINIGFIERVGRGTYKWIKEGDFITDKNANDFLREELRLLALEREVRVKANKEKDMKTPSIKEKVVIEKKVVIEDKGSAKADNPITAEIMAKTAKLANHLLSEWKIDNGYSAYSYIKANKGANPVIVKAMEVLEYVSIPEKRKYIPLYSKLNANQIEALCYKMRDIASAYTRAATEKKRLKREALKKEEEAKALAAAAEEAELQRMIQEEEQQQKKEQKTTPEIIKTAVTQSLESQPRMEAIEKEMTPSEKPANVMFLEMQIQALKEENRGLKDNIVALQEEIVIKDDYIAHQHKRVQDLLGQVLRK